MKRRHRPVIAQTVVPSDDAEADDVALVVEDLQPLRAGHGGEARHHVDLAEGADVDAVAVDDVAALDEMLVGLGVIEASNDGPHGGDRRVDGLDHDGAALVGSHGVRVLANHRVRHHRDGGEFGGIERHDEAARGRRLRLSVPGAVQGGGGIEWVKLEGGRHVNSSPESVSPARGLLEKK